MATEIERKFLVAGTGWKKLDLLKKVEIEQGYLHKSRECAIRVRVADSTGYMALKSKRVDIECEEYEYEIPVADAKAMMKYAVGPTVKKTRHYCRDAKNQVWEIDIFKGINRGLTMAEIELDSKKQVVDLPTWVGTEVSHDRRYTNVYLSEHKVPKK